MKKILSLIFIVAFVLLMSGCGSRIEGVKVSYEEDIVIIDLEDFVGEYSFRIKYDGPADGSLFYVAELTAGAVETHHRNWIFDKLQLFSASADDGIISGGAYVDSSTAKITVYIEATEPSSGKIILTFDRDVYTYLTEKNSK
jgi:hypothetical protein